MLGHLNLARLLSSKGRKTVFSRTGFLLNRIDTAESGILPSVAKKIGKKLLREVFSKFFGHAGAPMHKKTNRGHRDLSVVKFSAPYDAWSSKNEKRKNCGKCQNISKHRLNRSL